MVTTNDLYGLVLTGGRSTRMGHDKALMSFGQAESTLARLYALLTKYCAQSFVSLRRDQTHDSERSRFPQIVDEVDEIGPLSGILAAQRYRPDVAWLVVACDLPQLDSSTLSLLVAQRKQLKSRAELAGDDPDQTNQSAGAGQSGLGIPSRLWGDDAPATRLENRCQVVRPVATAFIGHKGMPEPLCAIYEPESRELIEPSVVAGILSPRRILSEANTHLLTLPNGAALLNVNRPEEAEKLGGGFSTQPAKKRE